MSILIINNEHIIDKNTGNILVFNLESTKLGYHLYLYGTDGKLYLSYTNTLHLTNSNRSIINKILISTKLLPSKLQLFKNHNISLVISPSNIINNVYIYIDPTTHYSHFSFLLLFFFIFYPTLKSLYIL